MSKRKSAPEGTEPARTEDELWFSRLIDHIFAPEWSSAADERAYAHLSTPTRVETPISGKPQE